MLFLSLCFFCRYAEAEAVITNGYRYGEGYNFEEIIAEYGDQSAFTLMLLAKIASKTERRQQSIEAFKRALKINPFLWSCFESLCNAGEKPNPLTIFQIGELENMSHCQGSNLSNIESVYISNNTTQDSIFITPQPLVNSFGATPNNIKHFTPDDASINSNNLCLSGIALLPRSRFKPVRFRYESVSSNNVSKQITNLINL